MDYNSAGAGKDHQQSTVDSTRRRFCPPPAAGHRLLGACTKLTMPWPVATPPEVGESAEAPVLSPGTPMLRGAPLRDLGPGGIDHRLHRGVALPRRRQAFLSQPHLVLSLAPRAACPLERPDGVAVLLEHALRGFVLGPGVQAHGPRAP